MNTALESLPVGVATNGTLTAIITTTELLIYDGSTKRNQSYKFSTFKGTCIDFAPDGNELLVGCDDNIARFFSASSLELNSSKQLAKNRGQITAVSYNRSNSDLIAVADANRQVLVYSIAEKCQVKIDDWTSHSARVSSFAWSPDGKHGASGSLDTNLEIWSVERPSKHLCIKNAHTEGVTGITWLGPDTVVSTGQDACIRGWKVPLP